MPFSIVKPSPGSSASTCHSALSVRGIAASPRHSATPLRASSTTADGSGRVRDLRVRGFQLGQAREDLLGQHARSRGRGQQLPVVVDHFPKPVESPRMKKRWPMM